jgi:hypothetical protein
MQESCVILGADLALDDTFEWSGGCPGTRFALRLNLAPVVDMDPIVDSEECHNKNLARGNGRHCVRVAVAGAT